MDLDKLDAKQLEALIAKAETARAQLRERRRGELHADFERRAVAEGFTLEEITTSKRRAKREPRYAHPTDGKLTWTGLGRMPAWLKKLAEGGDIEKYRTGA